MRTLMLVVILSVWGAMAVAKGRECSLKESSITFGGASFNDSNVVIKKSNLHDDSDYEIATNQFHFSYDKKKSCWRVGDGSDWDLRCLREIMGKNTMTPDLPLAKPGDK